MWSKPETHNCQRNEKASSLFGKSHNDLMNFEFQEMALISNYSRCAMKLFASQGLLLAMAWDKLDRGYSQGSCGMFGFRCA